MPTLRRGRPIVGGARIFATIRDLVDGLRAANANHVDMVLIDPGALAAVEGASSAADLRAALDELQPPYIEMHDDSDAALEPRLSPRHGPLATVIINRDLSASYRLALGIALRLGACATRKAG